MPEGDTLHRTADGLRPYLVGRAVLAARAAGPARGPQVGRVIGATVTGVEAVGKNLLVRFDNGLELRTHLRMNGSWHRYRPGERWRRPPSRARLVLEVPGAVAVCFDAPVVELLETRAEGLHPPLAALGPDLLDPAWGPETAAEAIRRLRDPATGRPDDRRSPRRPAGAGRDRQRLQERGAVPRAGRPVGPRRASCPTRRSPRWSQTARRLLVANADRRAGPERITTDRARAAAGAPLWVYDRAGRPCRRCGTLIERRRQGTDLPRLTFWCPRCQGGG